MREAKFKEIQVWFTVPSDSAMQMDGSFCIIMSEREAFEYLKSRLTTAGRLKNAAANANRSIISPIEKEFKTWIKNKS